MRIRSVSNLSWMLVCVLLALPASAHTLWSLDVSPSDVVGGSTATGTVRLTNEAPAGGVVVTLSSSNAAAIVPPSVTVSPGASKATFTIVTTVVSSDTTATISASDSHNTKTDKLTIEPVPAALVSFNISPTVAPVDTPVTGTVTLDKEPPHGGALVRLSSDNPAIKVPPVVKVDPHTTTDTFTIDTSHVEWSATATISATYEGVTKTAVLTVPCTLGVVPPPKHFPSTDQVWMNDDFPPLSLPFGSWIFDPTQKASGTVSFTTDVQPGQHDFLFFTDVNDGLHMRVGDRFVIYALIDPCNPPKELMFGLSDEEGNWDHVVYWGANLITDFGTKPKYMGKLPDADGNDGCHDGEGHHDGHGDGEDRTEWVRLEIPASAVQLEGRTVVGLWVLLYDGRVWLDRIGRSPTCFTPIANPPSPWSFKSGDVVWIDDSIPGDGSSGSPWTLDSKQKASGNVSFTMPAKAGLYDNFMLTGDAGEILVHTGDKIVVYMLIDPCDPPKEVLLKFRDTSSILLWDHAAYWGADMGIDKGSTWVNMGPLPFAGRWARLEIPASAVGMENQYLSGIWMYMYGGHVWFDRIGTTPATTQTTHH